MDSDLFDDILADNSEKTARSGKKFQPKAKPRGPRLMKTDSVVGVIADIKPWKHHHSSDAHLQVIKQHGRTFSKLPENSFFDQTTPSVCSIVLVNTQETSDVSENELKEYCETDRSAASGFISQISGLRTDDHRSFGVVNASPQHLGGTKNVDSIASLGPVMDVSLVAQKNADIFIVLESLGDFLPDSTTVLDNSVPSSGAPNVSCCWRFSLLV
ncbi:hypothetical protein ACH5RR_040566 [Cinchona calisaya]|uniref:Uncharacterized protein n=1 Tax=Cinchona calisaya TaxID=153742 RepID=A0ABD2XS22_9GENT